MDNLELGNIIIFIVKELHRMESKSCVIVPVKIVCHCSCIIVVITILITPTPNPPTPLAFPSQAMNVMNTIATTIIHSTLVVVVVMSHDDGVRIGSSQTMNRIEDDETDAKEMEQQVHDHE